MRIRPHLGQLRDDYLVRLDRLERKFDSILMLAAPHHGGKETLSYCVIELMNGYRSFNRALLASSMIGARTTLGTKTKVSGVACEFDFIYQVLTFRGKPTNTISQTWDSRNEPAWEAEINNLASHFGLQNQAAIDAAFSISGFYKDLKTVRNFLCHRSRLLFIKAKDVGLSHLIAASSAEEILLQQRGGGGYLFHYWVEQCRIYAEFSVE
jgi:hypothetical protein